MTGVKSPYVLGKDFEDHSSHGMPRAREMSDLGIDIMY